MSYESEESRRLNPWTYEGTCKHKPLSINRAYYKNRNKTKAYREYEKAWEEVLKDVRIPKEYIENIQDIKFRVDYEWGFSNKLSDTDNPIKTTTDILQNHFGFDDRQIYVVKAVKKIVPKGYDYAKVKIKEIFPEPWEDIGDY